MRTAPKLLLFIVVLSFLGEGNTNLTIMKQIDLDIRELKRLQQSSAHMLSEAAAKENRDDIIVWYNAYRKYEGEICQLEDIKKSSEI